ncbi:MAG: hypothetical protein ABF446_11685, partial [Acetobacter orientalis]|uniref:hypothetical protein n=1 Tax=Acetobacter orientalis TaxID=146474 RepID=UPI0039EBD413
LVKTALLQTLLSLMVAPYRHAPPPVPHSNTGYHSAATKLPRPLHTLARWLPPMTRHSVISPNAMWHMRRKHPP